jgi:outer membrane protein OmpA-like peptidoglycan-associated protein
MELPKKYSRRYIPIIYALFIILFAITLSLFYTSRFQQSSHLEKQDTDIGEQQGASDKSPKVTKKIDISEEQSSRKDDSTEPDNDVHSETIKAPLSKKEILDSAEKNVDSPKAPPGEAVNPNANLTRSQSAVSPGEQKTVIYFSDESTGLTDEALNQLRIIFLSLLKRPGAELILEGYGDSGIVSRHNRSLSQSRANVVKGYFVKRGISNSRIRVFWMGSENPASNDSAQAKSRKTHQVEVKFK